MFFFKCNVGLGTDTWSYYETFLWKNFFDLSQITPSLWQITFRTRTSEIQKKIFTVMLNRVPSYSINSVDPIVITWILKQIHTQVWRSITKCWHDSGFLPTKVWIEVFTFTSVEFWKKLYSFVYVLFTDLKLWWDTRHSCSLLYILDRERLKLFSRMDSFDKFVQTESLFGDIAVFLHWN